MNDRIQHINLSKYNLKRHHKGGYAYIFLAHPIEPGQPELIIKVLRDELVKNQALLNKFNEELLILKQVRHYGIPQYAGKGYLSGKPYLAYHYVKGMPAITLLQNRKNSGGISTSDACNIYISLLEILDYLHTLDNPVLHNDISLENVIIDNDQWVYLIDFGCAQQLTNEAQHGHTWRGKPSYLSPEQAQSNQWDIRSDLYQAGILFFELLTGKRKNGGIGIQETRAFAAEPLPLNINDIPDTLITFFISILAEDPDKRYQSARECIEELMNLRRSMGAGIPPDLLSEKSVS